eukprot:1267554-Prorocentrum_lima.AAC.1
MIIFTEAPVVRVVIEAFEKQWQCKINGVIQSDGMEREEEVASLTFLGMAVELVQGKVVMHQRPYLE